MKTGGRTHIAALAALLLLAVYALCIIGVLLAGAEGFSRLSARDEAAFDRRSAVDYVAAKLHRSDSAGGVSIDGDSLVLSSGDEYKTRIYCHDGWLRELFTVSGVEMEPSAGEKLLPAEDMSLRWEEDMLVVELCLDGENSVLRIHLRSCGEVEP